MREELRKQVALEHHMEFNWGRPNLVKYAQIAIDLVNNGTPDEYLRLEDGNITWVYYNEYGAVTAIEFVTHFRLEGFVDEYCE